MTLLLYEKWNTLSNWDYYIAGPWTDLPEAYRGLSSSEYVSPPTGLYLRNDGSLWSTSVALSKHASAQDLKTGTIITWAKRGTIGAKCKIAIGIDLVGGGMLRLISASGAVFTRHRLVWWQEAGVTKYRIDSWDGSNWVNGSIQETTEMTGSINRCGVCGHADAGSRTNRFDDTIIFDTVDGDLVAPTVTTDPATDVEAISATENGTLDDDGGMACDCGFEWGETVAYGNTTPTQSRTTGQSFSRGISGLSPNTLYHFRAFATNAVGTSYGADRTFTTLPSNPGITAPDVTTNPATRII